MDGLTSEWYPTEGGTTEVMPLTFAECFRFLGKDSEGNLQRASSAGDQVEDEKDDRENQKDVDHAASDMESETEEPENEQDYKDCPEHVLPPSRIGSAGPPWGAWLRNPDSFV